MLKRVLYTDDIQGSISFARGHESVATILMSIRNDAGFDLTTCKDALMSQAHGVQDAYMDVGGTITGRNR